jgi:hypothetical protein
MSRDSCIRYATVGVLGLQLATGAPIWAAPVMTLGEDSARYSIRTQSLSGPHDLVIRLAPEVRSLRIRLAVPASRPQNWAGNVQLDVFQEVERGGAVHDPIYRARILPKPLPEKARPTSFIAVLKPDKIEVGAVWRLRFTAVPLPEQAENPELHFTLDLDADARKVTAHERDLMEWRSKVDPARQPDKVREKIAELTDEEVRYYTGFRNRQNFLDVWGKVRAEDLGSTVDEDHRGLFVQGNALPNGQFIHR